MTTDQQQQWEAICGDATGRLYGVVQGPAADQGGGRHILVVDISPDSLASKDAQEASTPLSSLNVQQVVCTTPAIDFTVTAAAVSANGHQMLLVGSSHAEDTDVPVLALVDLYGSTPLSSTAPTAGGLTASSSLSSQYPSARLRMAGLFHVHRGLYDERPGMKLLQASWHPGSSSHFAVLASDNRWRLYHTTRLAETEQTFWLRLPGAQGSMGLKHRQRGAPSPPRLTAFAFGPQNLGWAAFTVLFLASDGGVYALCPVAPFGMRARGSMLRQLPGVNQRGTVHTWLLGAFLEVLSNEAAAAVSAQPHVLETLAPCLQGPLNLDQPSLKTSTGRRVACTMALSGSGSEGLGTQAGARFSALLTGFSSGTVYAHLLQLEQVLPCWQDATPQVVYDQRGEVAAVRYEVEAVAPKQPTQGLETVPEDGSSSGAASRLTSSRLAAAAAHSDLVSPLLLLDALKINLHLEPPASSATGGIYSRASPADSDEESDAGYDPSAPEQQQQHRGGSRSRSGVVRGLIGVGAGSNSDTDDEEDEQLQQLRKVTLHAAPELPGRFWACHDQGSWGINIKWLQQMNSSDGDAVAGAFGSLSGSSDGGWGQQQQRQQQRQQQQHGEQQQQQLPPPAVQELLVSGAGVSSSCVVGNALFGSGCVVLEKGLPGPQLVFLKPRPTGVLGEGVVGTAEGGGEAAAAAEEAGDELGVALLLLTPEELDTRSRQQEYYADITRGPHRLQQPAKPDNLASLSPADPQGLQYSRDVTSWLSETHVRFGVGVSVDLQKRIGELHDLVSDQEQLLGHLKHLAKEAAERQAGLQARIDRLAKAAAALSERGNLLASMHWSLPRPTSKAEQQMSRHLEVWEQQLQQTQKAWKALHTRLDKITSAAEAQKQQQRQQQQEQVAAAASLLGVRGLAASRAQGRQVTQKPSGPLTPAQLERVRELLQMQHAAIAADSAELSALSSQLEAWRLEHPEVDLPARLSRLGTVV